MDIKIFIVLLLMAFLVIFGFVSCFSNNEAGGKNSLKNSLDWEGVYTGSRMTDSGNLMNVRIRLFKEHIFEANYHYADGSYNTIDIKGRFQWDDTESIIIIDVIDAPIRYKVAKNKLIRLDEYDYVLEKVQ
jgi:copper homeostasis protein (lipoprotein)